MKHMTPIFFWNYHKVAISCVGTVANCVSKTKALSAFLTFLTILKKKSSWHALKINHVPTQQLNASQLSSLFLLDTRLWGYSQNISLVGWIRWTRRNLNTSPTVFWVTADSECKVNVKFQFSNLWCWTQYQLITENYVFQNSHI